MNGHTVSEVYINNKEIYKDQKLLIVLEGKSLFNFNYKTREITEVFKFVFLGKTSISQGIQFLMPYSKKVGNVGVLFYKRLFNNGELY